MMVPLVQLEDAVGGHLLGVMDVGVMMMVGAVDLICIRWGYVLRRKSIPIVLILKS